MPREAIDEIVRHCEAHRQLISLEAEEEARLLQEASVPLARGPRG